MRLSHIHLLKPIPYTHSLKLQEALVDKHYAHRALARKDASLASQPPAPTLLTFQTQPTYTVGRRHLNANPLSQSQISFLSGVSSTSSSTAQDEELATFFPSPRGGLLTYHAPGQLTAYLILNLRTHRLTPRCYIRMLENTVIRTCARHGVANTLTTDDPGVWIGEPVQATLQDGSKSNLNTDRKLEPREQELCTLKDERSSEKQNLLATNRKICAIGVHVSRGITSHGIGLNVFDAPVNNASPLHAFYTLPRDNIYTSSMDSSQGQSSSGGGDDKSMQDSDILAPGYLSWGFSRIVACGLEGKSVTWLAREQSVDSISNDGTLTVESVAASLAEEVAQSLMIEKENIERLTEDSGLEC